MAPRLAIKVDVDTLEGFCRGVPALLEVLETHAVKASFFLALGPDNSGRAIFRIFRQRGFLAKMWRTRAPALYGFKTMCYGTLLPGPKSAPPPRTWRRNWPQPATRSDSMVTTTCAGTITSAPSPGKSGPGNFPGPRDLYCAHEKTRLLFRRPGLAVQFKPAARPWRPGIFFTPATPGALAPYFPAFGERVTKILEIPTTLPTLDELLGFHGCRPQDFTRLVLSRLESGLPQVLTIHAEMEGGPFLSEFGRLLTQCRERGVEFFRLEDWARKLLKEPAALPVAQVNFQRLPGRAGYVSCQGLSEARPS